MTKNVEYIIVGGGYAGIFFAHQLLRNNKTFILFSDERKSASKVSAGIINPLVLKKFTTFWLAKEQLKFLRQTMFEIQQYLGEDYFVNEKVHRIIHDDKERKLWLQKSETPELLPYLNSKFESTSIVENPYGLGVVENSARINVDGLFHDFYAFLNRKGVLRKEKFQYAKLFPNKYEDIHFENIVFCEGNYVSENPYFGSIPIIPNKGHHLVVKLTVPLENTFTLKKKHFLFPLSGGLYYYGGTYDPNSITDEIDEASTQKLIEGLKEFYPHPFEVVQVNFGFRPTVKDRRPILGAHPLHSNFYVFNGLGARGILSGAYFSKELFDFIEFKKPLSSEVDLQRFFG